MPHAPTQPTLGCVKSTEFIPIIYSYIKYELDDASGFRLLWRLFCNPNLCFVIILGVSVEPRCLKTWKTFEHLRPAKIQISLRIRAVWSESSLSTFRIARMQSFSCGKRRLWSDCADTHANLSLCRPHKPQGTFSYGSLSSLFLCWSIGALGNPFTGRIVICSWKIDFHLSHRKGVRRSCAGSHANYNAAIWRVSIESRLRLSFLLYFLCFQGQI